MLYWALVFFLIAVVAAVLGFGGIAVAFAGVARILFFLFVVVFLVSLLMVVAASAYMTQGQVTLNRIQGQLDAVLGQHHLLEQQVARLSNPSTVVSQSQGHGLVAPTNVKRGRSSRSNQTSWE